MNQQFLITFYTSNELTPDFLATFNNLFTSNVLVRVTIGIGDVIQISNASALSVSFGFTSVFLL